MNNPIIDEIREARAALAAEHGYDLARINDWARQQTLARQLQNRRRENNKGEKGVGRKEKKGSGEEKKGSGEYYCNLRS